MPIYEFICNHCGLKFEFLVRNKEEKIVCPKCRHTKLRKLVSSFAFSSKSSPAGEAGVSSARTCSSCSSHNCASCSG